MPAAASTSRSIMTRGTGVIVFAELVVRFWEGFGKSSGFRLRLPYKCFWMGFEVSIFDPGT